MNQLSHTWFEYDQWRGMVEIPVKDTVVDGRRFSEPTTIEDMLSPALDAEPGQHLDLICDFLFTRPSYDFITWLCNADLYRQVHGFDEVRVRFKGQENGFVQNVLRPALKLFPKMKEGHDSKEQTAQITHMTSFMCEVYRRRKIMPQMKGPLHRGPSDYVTITLREADYWQSRNSNVAAWLEFAEHLRGRVIIIRDTAKADDPFIGFETSAWASKNLFYRMSLYEGAKMNYFVSNGPVALAQFTKHVPYVCFMKTPPDMDFHRGANLKYHFGIERGEQYPWATQKQRLVWSEDSYEEIMEACA